VAQGRVPGVTEIRGHVICDGRGNAGTGARAAVLTLEGGERFERAEKLEATTNIVAEHLAIQLAIELALEHGVTELTVHNDSQTPVNHVRGTYKVKQPHLRPLVEKTWEMRQRFSSFDITWVPRTQTSEADALCRLVDPSVDGKTQKAPR
jgi:ribonuclease HI